MDPYREREINITRRQLFGQTSRGIGVMALASLLDPKLLSGDQPAVGAAAFGGLPDLPHFAPKAKRVIYLHQSGAPSQIELFDYKPKLAAMAGTELPSSIRQGQRITGMTSGQNSFPVAPSLFHFKPAGKCGSMVSELLPHTSGIMDDITLVKTVNTDAINHDPAITFIQTGFMQPGRPSMGSWVTYGLGSENQNLPAFVVLISQANALNRDQPLFSRLWSSGFIPSKYQGVRFRASGDPVLFLANPEGVDASTRRNMLDAVSELNHLAEQKYGDPEISTRISQYEMAYRMQSSVPELTDLSKEPASTFDLYGPDSRKPGTYAANCLMARRLAERGVRFIQLYHRGWDQHNDLPRDIALQCKGTDQASAALVTDLKQRGLLDDTLVIWEASSDALSTVKGISRKTIMAVITIRAAFAMWFAGGGMKRGVTVGETDDFSYNVVADPVPIHDVQATVLRCLGIDHKRLTYKFQGRHFRLTDVAGSVNDKMLA